MKFRVCVVAVVRNKQGEYLICKKPKHLGVYPGQWGLPGGGIEEGERMDAALYREVMEEVGLEVSDLQPLHFRDDVQKKYYADGSVEDVYMIYLLFSCVAVTERVKLGEEFEQYAWVRATRLNEYDLNQPTRETFEKMGLL